MWKSRPVGIWDWAPEAEHLLHLPQADMRPAWERPTAPQQSQGKFPLKGPPVPPSAVVASAAPWDGGGGGKGEQVGAEGPRWGLGWVGEGGGPGQPYLPAEVSLAQGAAPHWPPCWGR